MFPLNRPKSPRRVPVTLSEHDGVRYLHMGPTCIQGAMRIAEPLKIELKYIERMLTSLLFAPSDELGQGTALQLGLGAGALTRFTAGVLRMPTTVIEIDHEVVDLNLRWFKLPSQVNVVVDDAFGWLARAEPASVRLLQIDLYDHISAAPVHDSEKFYASCRAALDKSGILSANIFGPEADAKKTIQIFEEIFGREKIFYTRPTDEGNVAVIALNGESVPDRATLTTRAGVIEDQFGKFGLRARKWMRLLQSNAGILD